VYPRNNTKITYSPVSLVLCYYAAESDRFYRKKENFSHIGELGIRMVILFSKSLDITFSKE